LSTPLLCSSGTAAELPLLLVTIPAAASESATTERHPPERIVENRKISSNIRS
jgi:hypothetical protein